MGSQNAPLVGESRRRSIAEDETPIPWTLPYLHSTNESTRPIHYTYDFYLNRPEHRPTSLLPKASLLQIYAARPPLPAPTDKPCPQPPPTSASPAELTALKTASPRSLSPLPNATPAKKKSITSATKSKSRHIPISRVGPYCTIS